MIEKIQNHSGSTAQKSSAAKAQGTGGASFAELHATAVRSHKAGTAAPATTTPNGAGKVLPGVNTALRPPAGETWGPVDGHPEYADILGGSRNGFYVNLAPGKRQGEAFLVTHKDGQTFHVYGEGKDKVAIPVREPRKPPAGQTWKPVDGHRDYKKVEGGKDDGKYVNLSRNERDGKHFEIVKKGDRTFHVYGEGKDKISIEVGWHKRAGGGKAGNPAAS